MDKLTWADYLAFEKKVLTPWNIVYLTFLMALVLVSSAYLLFESAYAAQANTCARFCHVQGWEPLNNTALSCYCNLTTKNMSLNAFPALIPSQPLPGSSPRPTAPGP